MRISSLVATTFVSVLSLVLAGCFEAGVGDPTKGKIDTKLVGLWRVGDDNTMLLVKAWDDRTYIVTEISRTTSADGVERFEPTGCYRAWLAEVAGKTFITLDQSPQRLHKVDRPFVVAQIDVQEDKIVARGLDQGFASAVHTTAEMEKHIRDNIDNPKLFTKDPATYQRVPESIAAMVK